MISFAKELSGREAAKATQAQQLIKALSEARIAAWESHPVAAAAHSMANASNSQEPDLKTPAVSCLNFLNDTTPAPIHNAWRTPLLKAAGSASSQYFEGAQLQFEQGDYLSATEDLCSSVNCCVIGHAAVRGWPHANTDDDLNTMFGLALGKLPEDTETLHSQLESMPDAGHALNSNYSATMGMPEAVRRNYFQENGYTPQIVMSFAKNAIELADRLASPAP